VGAVVSGRAWAKEGSPVANSHKARKKHFITVCFAVKKKTYKGTHTPTEG
jgi:hypothetical protein